MICLAVKESVCGYQGIFVDQKTESLKNLVKIAVYREKSTKTSGEFVVQREISFFQDFRKGGEKKSQRRDSWDNMVQNNECQHFLELDYGVPVWLSQVSDL